MGQQQSSFVANQLQNKTIEELLENDELVASLEPLAAELSRKSKNNLQMLAASSAKASKTRSHLQTGKLKPLLALKEADVKLHPDVAMHLEEWKHDWTGVFGDHMNSADPTRNAGSILFRTYNHMLFLQKRRLLDRIRWRFYAMFFYDLHCLINERSNVTSRGLNSIISAVDKSGQYAQQIAANLRSWIARGHRYRNLCTSLGGSGCLFLLPEPISDYLWEESLPLNGPAHTEAVERLWDLGIVQKSIQLGVHDLGVAIEQGLLDTFKYDMMAERSSSSYSTEYPEDQYQSLPVQGHFDALTSTELPMHHLMSMPTTSAPTGFSNLQSSSSDDVSSIIKDFQLYPPR